jgi:hypothetical protein
MLYKEIIAVCSQIHTKHTNTPCGQNVEFLNTLNLVVHIVTTGLTPLIIANSPMPTVKFKCPLFFSEKRSTGHYREPVWSSRPMLLPSFPHVLHAAPISDSPMGHPSSSNHRANIILCDAVCFGRCQLLGIKRFTGPNTPFVLRMETYPVYETVCSARYTRQ